MYTRAGYRQGGEGGVVSGGAAKSHNPVEITRARLGSLAGSVRRFGEIMVRKAVKFFFAKPAGESSSLRGLLPEEIHSTANKSASPAATNSGPVT